MLSLILDLAAPRRALPDRLARVRATWRAWSSLDPLTREYECERTSRGIALGVVLSFAVWAALWLLLRLA